MTSSIEALTTTALGAALDAASIRQQVIAANIANANVEGYVAHRVSFDTVLSAMGDARGTEALEASVTPRIEEVRDAQGHPQAVQLDAEVAELSRNQLQYQVLVAGLNKHFAILGAAASDGRR